MTGVERGEYDDAALRIAVLGADSQGARRLLAARPERHQDDVLRTLALLAAGDGPAAALATELLLEELDSSQVVHRFAGAALLDHSAVDDVVQDSLISIAGSIGSYSGKAKVTTWVHAIVRRRVVDHLRRQRATSPLPPEEAGPAERMSSMLANRATLREALEALPELYRAPVTLRDVEGLPYAEVAERLGRAPGTVKAQISRGRALLAAALRGTTEGHDLREAP